MPKKPLDDTAGKTTIFEIPSIERKEKEVMEEIRENNNIYQKLNKFRSAIHNSPLKKTGINKFQNYKYFELGDFIPFVEKYSEQFGLTGLFSHDYTTDTAMLRLVNSDKPEEEIIFRAPWVNSNTGTNPIQQMGADITYFRRYMWQIALELCENDIVDAEDAKTAPQAPKASAQQIKKIEELYTPAQIDSMLKKKGYGSLKEFTSVDATMAINFKSKEKESE